MISEGTPNSEPEPKKPVNVAFGDRHRLQIGQPAGDAGEQAHRRERHQEGRQPHIGDQQRR